MKKLILIQLLFSVIFGFSQEKFDIVSYKAPQNWQKEEKQNAIIYSKIDGGSWSQIILYKNTVSKGNINTDFDSEWKDLVEKNYEGISKPQKEKPESAEGWTVMSGSGIWKFNGNNVATILTVYSGFGACVSVVCNATAKPYLEDYQKFIANLDLYNGKNAEQNLSQNNEVKNNSESNSSPKKDGFKFNSTNFDDGWKSTVQEDWVEVTKGNIKVLLHYPKEGTIFPSNPENLTNTAWNILVSPRYRNLQNYKTAYIEDYKKPYFATGNATENQSGKAIFITLFRRGAGWLEVISPDSKTFAREFGFNPETIRWAKISEYSGGYVVDDANGNAVKTETELFDKLDNMFGRNKFAVSASDLHGEWSDRYASNTFYANFYTGAFEGISTFTSSQIFNFGNNLTYNWRLIAVNSYGGTNVIGEGKGSGNFKSINNWQLFFSDIEGKSKTYDAYFTAIKNGRVLWLNDAKFPGNGIFAGFVKK